MLIKDLIISTIVIFCLLYLLYICYSKYIESRQGYFKVLTVFLVVEVFRRSLIYGKFNGKAMNMLAIFQIILLIVSSLIYILSCLKNVQ